MFQHKTCKVKNTQCDLRCFNAYVLQMIRESFIVQILHFPFYFSRNRLLRDSSKIRKWEKEEKINGRDLKCEKDAKILHTNNIKEAIFIDLDYNSIFLDKPNALH